jgi:folate-binding Fe-S cluster repair protein YgfZ
MSSADLDSFPITSEMKADKDDGQLGVVEKEESSSLLPSLVTAVDQQKPSAHTSKVRDPSPVTDETVDVVTQPDLSLAHGKTHEPESGHLSQDYFTETPVEHQAIPTVNEMIPEGSIPEEIRHEPHVDTLDNLASTIEHSDTTTAVSSTSSATSAELEVDIENLREKLKLVEQRFTGS